MKRAITTARLRFSRKPASVTKRRRDDRAQDRRHRRRDRRPGRHRDRRLGPRRRIGQSPRLGPDGGSPNSGRALPPATSHAGAKAVVRERRLRPSPRGRDLPFWTSETLILGTENVLTARAAGVTASETVLAQATTALDAGPRAPKPGARLSVPDSPESSTKRKGTPRRSNARRSAYRTTRR